jgi:hypothetical protein
VYRAAAEERCTARKCGAIKAVAAGGTTRAGCIVVFYFERERGLVRGLGCWHGKHRSCHLEGRESSLNPLRGT